MNRLWFSLLLCIPVIASAFDWYPYPYWGGMEYPRYRERDDGDITVIVITGDSQPDDWEYGIPYGNMTMSEMWKVMYDEDARFTVRAGNEYLVYSNRALVYTDGDRSSNVMIHPEELWYIINHCYRPIIAPATGQTLMEAWFPGMDEPMRTFLTVNDPAMSVVQVLLQRGREHLGTGEL